MLLVTAASPVYVHILLDCIVTKVYLPSSQSLCIVFPHSWTLKSVQKTKNLNFCYGLSTDKNSKSIALSERSSIKAQKLCTMSSLTKVLKNLLHISKQTD